MEIDIKKWAFVILACLVVIVVIGVEIYVHGINQEVKDSMAVNSTSVMYSKEQKEKEELEIKCQELQMKISQLKKKRENEQYALKIYKVNTAVQCYFALDIFMQQNEDVDVRYNEIVRCINNYYENFDDYHDEYAEGNEMWIRTLNNILTRYGDDKEKAVEAVYNEVTSYTDRFKVKND